MKSHIIFLSVLLSFVYGCTQPLNNISVSQRKNAGSLTQVKDIHANENDSACEENHVISEITGQTDSATYDDGQENQTTELADSATYDKETQDETEAKKDDIEGNGNSSFDEEIEEKEAEDVLEEALDLCEESQDYWQRGELEKALETLDHAYSLIVEVDEDDKPDLMQQKEDLRFMISKRILEIYASRNTVVVGQHDAIPMVMNEHVQAEIDLFMKSKDKRKGFFFNAYKRSGKYRPYIVSELKKAGLPVELSWLPLIESGFNMYALSNARALGLWQFIQSTGAKFGLKRDKYVDERLDPEKATKAAVAYFKELHNIFGDWSSVLASYNCGEGRVLRVIRQQNVNYLDNFWDLYERLPRETARFVPKFLATLHIVSDPEKYGLDLTTLDSPPEYETVTILKQVHLKDVAKAIGTSQKKLRELNPELRYNIVPNSWYSLRVPPATGDILLSKLDELSISSPPEQRSSPATQKKSRRPKFKYYRVKKGDTLSKIARKYHASVKDITRANRISKRKRLTIGKKLKIPVKGNSKIYGNKTKVRRSLKHVVKRGDSLWNIARRYGTTTKQIRHLNNLRNTRLRIGQVLKIAERNSKKGTKTASNRRDLKTYKVKSGDVPRKIAKQYNMPLDRFLRVNHLTQRSKIYPGQKLYVD